jgi:hypothetical protein
MARSGDNSAWQPRGDATGTGIRARLPDSILKAGGSRFVPSGKWDRENNFAKTGFFS